jgi:hypothetical protein
MLMILCAAAVLQQAPAAAVPQSDAYLDRDAAVTVAGARAQRQRAERLVTSYSATVTQRIGAGLRALSRDRMLFSQELAARITWQRDAQSRIEVIGARQRVPIAVRGTQIPGDLDAQVGWLVVNPGEDYLRMFGDDAEGWVHPLRDGSEADYRFQTGDTTVINLAGRNPIRVVELKVLPRRPDFKLISGSLWFDAETYGLVRAVFRPARDFDLDRDGDEGDDEDVPGIIKPIGAEVRYVTLEYGLYEQRWWMLRYFAADAEAYMRGVRMPVRFEREYTQYRVQGGAPPPEGSTFRPAGSVRRRSERDSLRALRTPEERDSIRTAFRECVRREIEREREEREARGGGVRVGVTVGNRYDRCRGDADTSLAVLIPEDTLSLLDNQELGAPILQMGDVISEAELRQFAREIGAIPVDPVRGQVQQLLPGGLVGNLLRNTRYNRVEALSPGLNGSLPAGRFILDGTARIGLADLEPNFELGATMPRRTTRWRLGGYRRLAAANPETKPFGVMNSLYALLAQRDDGEYFRTLGGELTVGPAAGQGWQVRLYAEQQRPAEVGTQASLPHLFNQGNVFRPNIVADTADQAGVAVRVRATRAVGVNSTVGAELNGGGEAGDFEFGKGALILRGTTILGGLALGVEGAAGTSSGGLPVQSQFYIGGPYSLRGYDGGVMRGDAFWRGRLEVGTGMPAVRLVTFSDVGWAGDRADFTRSKPLLGVGVGAAFLDGIVRMDLSRATRAPTGWRFDIYLDGLF